MIRHWIIYYCAVLIALAGHSIPVQSQTNEPFKKKIIHQGISVELSIEPVEKNSSGKLLEGEHALFRFKITDTTTGSPLTRANPAAWMNIKGKAIEGRTCEEKVQEFLSGSILSQAELDLNVFYVLALNNDNTITVVDPRFGFGGTKLLALVSLKSPGEDWALTSDEATLFVSMPDSNQVAAIDTATWKVISNLDVGPRPTRVALQPDQQYLWVAYNQSEVSGVAVVTVAGLKPAARVPTGRGPHQIAFTADNRFALVTNRDDDTVSVIDIRTLKKIKDVKVGRRPVSIAFSSLSQMAYVSSEGDGTITVIDGRKHDIVTQMKAEPGLGQIKIAPGGRLGFVANPEKDVVHIFDTATNRIVQTADVEDGPDQIAFSNELAYVRHRGSETVLMIPLKEVGVEGRVVSVVDFPGGQYPFGKTARPGLADSIVQAGSDNAVLVANPADRAIYFYKEGMAAPMGNFSNYGREPRAALIVNRSLRERQPGVYQTIAQLRQPGLYDVAFFLNTPRLVHCFEVAVDANPELAEKRQGPQVAIEPLIKNRVVRVGERVRLQFKLINPNTKQPRTGLKDVRVLTFLAPGVWHERHNAESVGDGVYQIEFVPPQAGMYYVYVECQSLGLTFNNPQYLVLEAKSGEGGSGK